MSANVWFEQVDKGLLTELSNTVRIKDENDILVPLSSDVFVVRKPEEDFKPNSYPCVSIYNLEEKFDPMRYMDEPVVISKDEVNHVMTVEESCVPFNLSYQIDFWAKYQEDINSMTATWLAKHFRQFNLEVIDDGGVIRSCNCLMKGSVKKSDLILNKERLFHTIISYSIWVELDSETRYNVNMVTDTSISV